MAAQDYNDNRKKEMQDILAKLEQGVKDVFSSDNYKNYLSVMSKFHKYSVSNSMLIALQKPEASLVAGYKAWLENKRQVKKGEKSIRILAPQSYTVREERDVTKKDEKGNFIFANGKPVTEKQLVEEKRMRFVPVSVFDVSQTFGEPLPSLKKVEELNGVVPEREAIFNALKNVSKIPIDFFPISGGTKGYYSPIEQKIAINTGMSDMQTIKTGIHEVAHKILHDPQNDVLSAAESRNKKEVQAESVAYVVSNHLGLDTSDYSFGYIAGWSSGKELNELKTSLTEIQKAAALIIDEVEKELTKLREIPPLSHDDKIKMSYEYGKKAFLDGITNASAGDKEFLNTIVAGSEVGESIPYLEAWNKGWHNMNMINEPVQPMPDTLKVSDMIKYGYDYVKDGEMLPLGKDKASELFAKDDPVYLLHKDNTESIAESINDISEHFSKGGIAGIKKGDWMNIVEFKEISSKASSNLEQAMNELQGSDKKPLLDKPVVTVLWSEHNDFKDNEKYSLAVFDEKIKRYDRHVFELKKEAEAKDDYYPYFKTKFQIEFPMNGENHTYTGRQDIGDGDGGVIDHIKLVASHELNDTENFNQWDDKAKEDIKWVLDTFVPYLENAKEIEMTEDKISQLNSSIDMLKAEKELVDKELSENVSSASQTKDNYKFFYAGSGGQDKEAIQYQKETGWKRIWASDSQGVNGDTWVVYSSVEELPKWLQEYAAAQEKLGKTEAIALNDTGKSSTKDNNTSKLRDFLINLQNDEYSGKQDYFIFKKDNGDYFFITDACNQFNHVATGSLSSDGNGDGSGLLHSISKKAAHYINDVKYDPVDRLCSMVEGMEYLGTVRDERVLVESRVGYNKVKPTCEWAYALEQYKQKSLVIDKAKATKGKRDTSKSSNKGIANRMAAAKEKAKTQSKTAAKSKTVKLEER